MAIDQLSECRKRKKLVQFMKVKRSENLDAKKLLRIDKIRNVGNPKVKNLIKIKSFLTNIDIFHLKNTFQIKEF